MIDLQNRVVGTISQDPANILGVKRRLIESDIECGDPEYARRIIGEVHHFIPPVRIELPTLSATDFRGCLRNSHKTQDPRIIRQKLPKPTLARCA
jgi:hypothetical protein